MRLLRRYRTCLLLCVLAPCLLILMMFAYGFNNIVDFQLYFRSSVHFSSIQWTHRNESGESFPRQQAALPLSIHCNHGRLGNQMCTYATLYGISALNHRHFISLSCNIKNLKDIFVGPSDAPAKDSSDYLKQHPWKLFSYLRPEDASLPNNTNFLAGYLYPCSFTFFDHVRDGIRREFRFHEHFNQYAQAVLHKANYQHLINVTFVGVHVRRGDYQKRWLEVFKGVPVNKEYFQKAFQYFREKYRNVIFIAVSDDRLWCRKNLSERFDGVYVPEEAPSPAHDLAILANCNHTVMTYGTFGFWGSYLAGGEVFYFDKFLKPNTSFTRSEFVFEKMYPPHWKGIVTVNVSNYFQAQNNKSKNVTVLTIK